jgi:hypothetical protein
MARAPDVTGNAGNAFVLGFNDSPQVGIISGTVGNTPFTVRGIAGAGSEAFGFATSYTWPSGAAAQVVPAGYNSGLLLPTGLPYPPGYKVGDGVTPGGVFPSGNVSGIVPIKIQPPFQGYGRQKFVTLAKFTVNCGGTPGGFYCTLGTTDSSTVPDPGLPLWPFLGVAHDLPPLPSETMSANETRSFVVFRMDVVDNSLLSPADQVSTWPNWKMNPSQSSLLWPGIAIIFVNTGGVSLNVSNIFAVGFSC